MPSAKNKKQKNILHGYKQIACICALISILTLNIHSNFTTICTFILLNHPQTFELHQLVYYGLTADVFDGESEYENNHDFNPMFALRKVCHSVKQSNHTSISTAEIKQMLLETAYPNTPSFIQKNIFLPLLNMTIDESSLNISNSTQMHDMNDLINSMDALSYFLQLNCIPEIETNTNYNKNMVVIGASSSGLMSILSAFHSGIDIGNIVVIEKRSSYLRDIWFDLYDEPFYVGKQVLTHRFGFDLQTMEVFINWVEDMEVYIMRAQILERFLAKIVYIIGIDIAYQHQLENVYFDESTKEYVLQIVDLQTKQNYNLRFDHLIGSDGAKSKVRELFNVSYTVQNEIVYNEYIYKIRNLFELSLVVRFKATNDCPALGFNEEGEEKDPWSISFEDDTIDAVFKRFYFHHCHFEILLNHKSELIQNELQKNENDIEYIEDLVLNVSRFYLEDKVESVEELKRDYLILNKRNDQMFRIVKGEIYLVDSSIKLFEEESGSEQMVFFVGDAAMTAHYRLGIGINTILDGYHLYLDLFQEIQKDEYDLSEIREIMDDRLMEKVLFQTTVIWQEGLCHLLVFFGFDKPLDRDNMKLWFRNHQIKEYDEPDEDDLTAVLEQCLEETAMREDEVENLETDD